MVEYLPPVLREIRDFECLMSQFQGAFSELWSLERETEDHFYVLTAGEQGLAHWERILGIVPRGRSTLEGRRQVVLARISQGTPYCWRTFQAFLTALLGTEEAFCAEILGFTLAVLLRPAWWEMRDLVWDLMRYVVPANMEMHLITAHNTHGRLRMRTHGNLRVFTQAELRNEVELI